MPRLRSLVANIALIGFSVAVVAVGVEIFLRAFPQFLSEEAALRLHWNAVAALENAEGQSMIVADPEIGFLYRPDNTVEISRGDLSFSFVTDSSGFRNATNWPEAADIVVLGDSMAFGYGVSAEEAWPSLVGDTMQERILNLGMIGAAPQQYTRIYERFAAAVRHDLVLYTLFPGNDFNDAANFAGWMNADRPVDFAAWQRGGSSTAGWRAAIEDILGRSRVLLLLRDSVKALRTPFGGETLDLADGGRVRLAPTAYLGNAVLAQPDNPAFDEVLTAVMEAYKAAEASGAAFGVLLVPTKERVYLPLIDKPVPENMDAVLNVLDSRGIPYLDLTGPLRAEARAGYTLYFEVDGHPNALGNKVIGAAVVAWLRETFPNLSNLPQAENAHDAKS